jgi:hypothetical protein
MIHVIYLVMKIGSAAGLPGVPVQMSAEHTMQDCQNTAAAMAAEEPIAKRSEWFCVPAYERDPGR